ncbi:MAG: hypothetical protein QOJ04_1646, partial [Caballeronia sp.]|nr:hypothetical protein [Caballeronia sp.]
MQAELQRCFVAAGFDDEFLPVQFIGDNTPFRHRVAPAAADRHPTGPNGARKWAKFERHAPALSRIWQRQTHR